MNYYRSVASTFTVYCNDSLNDIFYNILSILDWLIRGRNIIYKNYYNIKNKTKQKIKYKPSKAGACLMSYSKLLLNKLL